MNYFCKVKLQAAKNQEKEFFLILESENGEAPALTKEHLVSTSQYDEFKQRFRPKKLTTADYIVYSTEREIYASTQDEDMQILINNNQATKIAQAEIIIAANENNKVKLKKKKNRKNSPLKMLVIGGGILIVGVFAFGFGQKMGKESVPVMQTETPKNTTTEDGMIIPIQQELSDDVEQITITIDRSYSPTPTEDIQLKGQVIDGVAQITLPDFDKTDFFTHVQGYTYGFSTNPDATKIEYNGGLTYKFAEDTKLYRVLVKYGGGSGTKEDPYIINYYDQLELLAQEKARGYFKQVADLEFPSYARHTPIDTVNELKAEPNLEQFEYDGGGYSITNLSAPLFGKVSGAVIKNVNIKNSVIRTSEYKDLGFIVCNAYNYHYVLDENVYQTDETLIKSCSVSHSSIIAEYPQVEETTTQAENIIVPPVVVPPDIIEYDENGNIIEHKEEVIAPVKKGEHCMGAISGVGGQIENCYATDVGLYANLDDYFLYAGGISGKPANVINSGVYFFSATGNIFSAGGIVGSAGGARMYDVQGKEYPLYYGGNIQGCVARKIILATELSGGGIAGEATSNAKNPIISNCYATELDFTIGVYDEKDGKLIKSGVSGGIIGADGDYRFGHSVMNTVSLADFNPIGEFSLSKYDESIRLAPDYAFYQQNILTVINKNTIDTENPKEIFTGDFKFSDNTVFGDDNGALAYPSAIEDLFNKTIVEEK